tara:strand:+ start:301 stop:570 length:270 start_codon:yes stop_codon:yes gene_type:complete
MNTVKTTTEPTGESEMSPVWAFINYALNKYMPLLVVSFVAFYTLGYATWETYLIIGLMIFSNNFNFKCGYAHAYLSSMPELHEEEEADD